VRAAVRRLALIFGGVVGVTAVLSAAIGTLAGASLGRALATGFYAAGALALIGTFVFGSRGPLRPVFRDAQGGGFLGGRGLRKATPDERTETASTAILLFALGIALIAIGALLDPERPAY
jgi:hypothetical protein